LFSKVIIISSGKYFLKVQGCRYTKLIDFIYIIIGRDRYHKNSIINNGFSLLVGIAVVLLLELVLLIAGTM